MLIGKEDIVIARENYLKLEQFDEESLTLLAKQFDEDFYTNDGYLLEIRDYEFYYDYDDGRGNIRINAW